MKKATMINVLGILNGATPSDEMVDAIKAEIEAELNKGAAEKAARAEAYEGIHRIVVDNLSETPITCADLFTEIEAEITAKGMTRYNVQYALNNLWQDEIVKVAGKPNTYRKA